jgi:hypothetical protein
MEPVCDPDQGRQCQGLGALPFCKPGDQRLLTHLDGLAVEAHDAGQHDALDLGVAHQAQGHQQIAAGQVMPGLVHVQADVVQQGRRLQEGAQAGGQAVPRLRQVK